MLIEAIFQRHLFKSTRLTNAATADTTIYYSYRPAYYEEYYGFYKFIHKYFTALFALPLKPIISYHVGSILSSYWSCLSQWESPPERGHAERASFRRCCGGGGTPAAGGCCAPHDGKGG